MWTDEFYFIDHLNPGLHPVLVADRTKLEGTSTMKLDLDAYPVLVPLAWWQKFDGGREFYIALGHNKEEYSKPMLYSLISNGIMWAVTR